MLDLFSVVCVVYGKGVQVLVIWDANARSAKEEAKFHFNSANCVVSCTQIASGWCAEDDLVTF